jgi:hypothetical protein
MANRQRAVRMAERGASAREIRRETGVTNRAANRIVNRAEANDARTSSGPSFEQAPYPEYFKENPPPVDAIYIEGLFPQGHKMYDERYGGGGWAAGVEEVNGSTYNSIEKLKAFFRRDQPTAEAGFQQMLNSNKEESIRRALDRLQSKQEKIKNQIQNLDLGGLGTDDDLEEFASNQAFLSRFGLSDDIAPNAKRRARLERKSKRLARRQSRFQGLLNQMTGI